MDTLHRAPRALSPKTPNPKPQTLEPKPQPPPGRASSSSLLLSSLELSDTKVYEPYIRARPGTAAHFCEGVVLKLKPQPSPGRALRRYHHLHG